MTRQLTQAIRHSLREDTRRRRLPLLALACSVLAAPLAAAAQEPAAAPAAADGNGQTTDLDVITVTAQRLKNPVNSGALGTRSELDTPFPTSTVTARELEERQAYSLLDAFAADASVSRGSGDNYNAWSGQLTVRGLPMDFAHSTRINGQYVYLYGVNLPLENMDEVQLLKGSSGFMYGFGVPGGIVNYVTKKSTSEDVRSFDLGYRSGSLFSQHVDLGGRAGADGRLGYRFNASHEQGDTYADSHVRRTAAALALDTDLGSDVSWTADLLYQDSRVDRPMPQFSFHPYAPYDATRLPVAPDPDRLNVSRQTFNDSRFYLLSSGLEWRFAPDWSARLNATRYYLWRHSPSEYFFFENQAGDYTGETWDSRGSWTLDSAQAMVEGRFATGGIAHQLVAGVSWQNGDTDISRDMILTDSFYPGLNLHTSPPQAWTPLPESEHHLFPMDQFGETGVFLSDTVDLSSRWSVLAGVRWIDYEQVSRGFDFAVTDRYAKKTSTPTLAVMYKPAQDATLYASYTESLEQGASVPQYYENAYEKLDPLASEQYEAGLKWQRSRWDLAVSLFLINRGAEYANADNVYVQDGQSRYQGLDLSARVVPLPGLELAASATWLDARYRDTEVDWLVDRRAEGTSRLSAALGASYQFGSLPDLRIYANGRYTGATTVHHVEENDLTVMAPGVTVWNAGGSYVAGVGARTVTFRLELQNLADRRYWQGGGGVFALGASRTVAFNVKVDL